MHKPTREQIAFIAGFTTVMTASATAIYLIDKDTKRIERRIETRKAMIAELESKDGTDLMRARQFWSIVNPEL